MKRRKQANLCGVCEKVVFEGQSRHVVHRIGKSRREGEMVRRTSVEEIEWERRKVGGEGGGEEFHLTSHQTTASERTGMHRTGRRTPGRFGRQCSEEACKNSSPALTRQSQHTVQALPTRPSPQPRSIAK